MNFVVVVVVECGCSGFFFIQIVCNKQKGNKKIKKKLLMIMKNQISISRIDPLCIYIYMECSYCYIIKPAGSISLSLHISICCMCVCVFVLIFFSQEMLTIIMIILFSYKCQFSCCLSLFLVVSLLQIWSSI